MTYCVKALKIFRLLVIFRVVIVIRCWIYVGKQADLAKVLSSSYSPPWEPEISQNKNIRLIDTSEYLETLWWWVGISRFVRKLSYQANIVTDYNRPIQSHRYNRIGCESRLNNNQNLTPDIKRADYKLKFRELISNLSQTLIDIVLSFWFRHSVTAHRL
jgi:hypothetical protein